MDNDDIFCFLYTTFSWTKWGFFSASSTTQETGGLKGDFSEKSTVTDMKDTTDEMNWNLMLENNKSAIPENYGSN